MAEANRELITSINETAQALSEGTLQVELFKQGQSEAWQEVAKMGQEVIKTQGYVEQFNQLLGEAQTFAFNQGILDINQSMKEMQVETANTVGEIQALNASVGSVSDMQARLVSGFFEGSKSALEFIANIDTASGSIVGYRSKLEEAAQAAGITLPQGINTTNESLERQIAIAKGSVQAFQEYAAGVNEAGNALGTMFAPEKLKDINDEVDDWADNLRKQWDIKIGKGLEEQITQMNLEGAFETQLGQLLGMFEGFVNRPGFANFGGKIIEFLKNGVDNASPQLQASINAMMTAVEQALACPTCPGAMEKVHNAFATFNDNMGEDAETIKENIRSMAEQFIEDLGGMEEAIDQLIAKRPEFAQNRETLIAGGENDPATIQRLLSPPEGITPAARGGEEVPQLDFTQSIQSLDQLKTHALQVIGEINLAVSVIGPTWNAAFTRATQNAAGSMNLLVQHTTGVMQQVSLSAASVAEQWTTHFNTATQNAAGVMNNLLAHAQTQMAVVGATAQQVAVAFTQAFNQGAQNAAGSINQLVSHVSSQMSAMAGTFTQVAVAMTQNFEQGAQNAAGSINTLTTHVGNRATEMVNHLMRVVDAMTQIGTAASSAASEVNSLASAINSVPTERTITFRINTVGSIPSGGSVGGGLGFFDGTAYLPMAGGSAGGISGQGFAPIVIDHPTNLLVGESGPELVSVTPLNNNGIGRSGEKSPFANLSMAGGSEGGMFDMSNAAGTIIQTQSVTFDQNQGPIQILQGQGQGQGLPTGSVGSFGNTNVPLGTGQGNIFNVPGGQGAISGNATVCINGECFGSTQGLGAPIGSTNQQQLGQQAFTPVFDENGMIKAIETSVEWFKFLGLPTGASIPGTGTTTTPIPATQGTITGRGAFASTGQGAFAGIINMQGGQVTFDSNQGDMELQTSTGAISIAGQGGAFAQAGSAIASAGGVGIFGQENTQLTQLNRTMNEVSGSLQAVGNSMASLGDEVVFGNQQLQQTLQGTGPGGQNISGGTPVVFQGTGNVGFQSFPGGGAVGAGGASGDPLGFLSNTFGQLGLQLPAGIPSSGGQVTPGTGGTGTIGTGGTGCNVCGAATGLGNAATDLSGAAGQLGNAVGQMPTGGNLGTTGGTIPTGGMTGGNGTGGMNNGTQPGTGAGCDCSCMPMDSDPNRYKIEDGQGNDCNSHIYFDTIEECHSRLNEICPGENTNTPTPTPTNPTPTPGMGGAPTLGGNGMFPPGVMVSGPGAVACVNGQCFGSGGAIGGMGQVPGGQTGLPIGSPPEPPRIVQQAGLPSQPDVNQDPTSWTIVESAGLVGTYDIIDDNGNVVQLGFRTLSDAETYLNYFISYYEWVESGSTGIPGPVPVAGGTGGIGTGGGIPSIGGITAGAGGVQAIAGGGGAFASAGNAIAQAGSFAGIGGATNVGPRPIVSPTTLLESIPRAQGPFRSGQDNMEPIYDNSGIKIGADFGTPLEIGTTSMEDVEEGPKVKRSRIDRLRLHRDTAIALAGDHPEWIDAFLTKFEQLFGDLVINLAVNNMIDGYAVNQSQKKYQIKKVSVFT